jgi:hypothetical protein
MMRYYVYRITCLHPDSVEKYYYGFRSCDCDPREDAYWSSSEYVKEAIKKYGYSFFKKKIIREFLDRESAISLEIKLHNRFEVDTNALFFNRCKQSKWGYNCTGNVLKGKTYEEIVGLERAQELRILRSNKAKGKDNSGKKNPMYGRKHSDDMKRKLSLERQGKNHPTYGWKWITDGKNSLKIDPTSAIIPNGWYYGRKVPRKVKNNV